MVSSQFVVEMSTPSSWVRIGSIELIMLPSSGPAKAPTAMPAKALTCAIRPSPGAVSVEVAGPERWASWVSDTVGSSSAASQKDGAPGYPGSTRADEAGRASSGPSACCIIRRYSTRADSGGIVALNDEVKQALAKDRVIDMT